MEREFFQVSETTIWSEWFGSKWIYRVFLQNTETYHWKLTVLKRTETYYHWKRTETHLYHYKINFVHEFQSESQATFDILQQSITSRHCFVNSWNIAYSTVPTESICVKEIHYSFAQHTSTPARNIWVNLGSIMANTRPATGWSGFEFRSR